MGKILRWTGYGVAGVIGLAVVAASGVYLKSNMAIHAATNPHPETIAASTTPIAEAQRQLVTLGCADCHGAKLTGKAFLDDPKVGIIWAPNLTDVAHRASDQQLARAVRQGIGVDGRPLYIMPAVQYRYLSDTEIADVIRAIRATPRGGAPSPPIRLGPLGRIGIVTGRFPSQPQEIAAQTSLVPPDLGPATQVGRHLVMTHCSDCHGPQLTGSEPEPGVKSPDLMIAGAYDDAAFAQLLRAGRPADGRTLKLMGDVAKDTFSKFTDQEISQIHAYLKARAQKGGG